MSLPLPPLLFVDDEKNMRLSLQAIMADEGFGAGGVDTNYLASLAARAADTETAA